MTIITNNHAFRIILIAVVFRKLFNKKGNKMDLSPGE